MNSRYLVSRSLGAIVSAVVLLLCISAHAQPPSGDFTAAQRGYQWSFPRDHGAHEQYQTEWWYYTGQLVAPGEQLFERPARVGFQLTFFRRSAVAGSSSAFDQRYLAHAALTLVDEDRYLHRSQSARGGLALAGASTRMLSVFIGEWSAEEFSGQHLLKFTIQDGEVPVSVRLLVDARGVSPVFHGESGFSSKGGCERCASQYYSLAGVPVSGTIERGERLINVTGLSWMDHEFMSNVLQEGQVGWDWFSLMRADGSRVMLFRVRGDGKDPTRGDFYAGTLVKEGISYPLTGEEFSLTPQVYWQSPRGTRYPSVWRIAIPKFGINEELQPLVKSQEFVGGESTPSYWEGAVRSKDGDTLGYAELTGYERAISGAL